MIKFNIKSLDRPNKIVIDGGRGSPVALKAGLGVMTFGIDTVTSHFGSPKRIINVYFHTVAEMTKAVIETEGSGMDDIRVAILVNKIHEVMTAHDR